MFQIRAILALAHASAIVPLVSLLLAAAADAQHLSVEPLQGAAGTTAVSRIVLRGENISGIQLDLTAPDGAAPLVRADGGASCVANPAIDRWDSAYALLPNGCVGDACRGVRVLIFTLGPAAFIAAPMPAIDREAGPLLRDWCDKILDELKSPLYKPLHRRCAASHVDTWIRPKLGHVRLGHLTRADLLALRSDVMREGRDGKGATQKHPKNVIATLSSMLTQAVERGVIKANVAAGLRWPRTAKPAIDPFTRDEVEILLGYLRVKHPYADRLVLCLADTGMRPGAAVGLTWGNIDLRDEGLIMVRRSRVKGHVGTTKTAKSERTLQPVSARLLAELRAIKPLRADGATPVFIGPTGAIVRQENLQQRVWEPACRAKNIRPRTVYKLRSTFISLSLSAGANQQWLADYTGTSLEMFARHYARFLPPPSHTPLSHLPGSRLAAPPIESAARRSRKAKKGKGE